VRLVKRHAQLLPLGVVGLAEVDRDLAVGVARVNDFRLAGVAPIVGRRLDVGFEVER